MNTVKPTGTASWTLGPVDATHGAALSIEVMAAPLLSDGSVPPITDFSVRATLNPTVTSIALADLNPPLAVGGEAMLIMAINSGGSSNSTVVPFTLTDYPPSEPVDLVVS
jgi:hypothetical protein